MGIIWSGLYKIIHQQQTEHFIVAHDMKIVANQVQSQFLWRYVPLVQELKGVIVVDHPLRVVNTEALPAAPNASDFLEQHPDWVLIKDFPESPRDLKLETVAHSGIP